MPIKTQNDSGFVEQLAILIKQSIAEEIDKITKEEWERAERRIEERKAEAIAGVALRVSKNINYESYGSTLQINVKLDDNPINK